MAATAKVAQLSSGTDASNAAGGAPRLCRSDSQVCRTRSATDNSFSRDKLWVLASEKNVYAGQDFGVSIGGFGGSLYHTTAFAMDAGTLTSFGTRTEFHAPSADQLEKLKA